MTIDELVAAIRGLTENDKAEMATKLQAAAEVRPAFRTLRAARAVPENRQLVNYMLAEARRLGVKIDEDVPPNLVDIDRALAGKPIDSRVKFKSMLAELKMIA